MMEPDPVWEQIRARKNVVGMSKSLKARIKDGTSLEGTRVIRVYVSRKEPAGTLAENEVIPPLINGIETDVVEIGTLKALPADQ